MLTCSYKEQEFIRIGYYISNDLQLGAEVHTSSSIYCCFFTPQ